ncbi:hypothetical protein PSACC_01744 [Paramicrosporidium saccamoebae]|uniref:Myb-like domain-containing protein n=1 Tax=Paramicrosporidium saccamoebae TaxID=1246581 RepID=A0A2H9TKY7_9FUNG|nr:hypothetical protein PSACC_01744 [Paramicrosporidium saccamoebae]
MTVSSVDQSIPKRRQKPTPAEIAELRDLFASRWLTVESLREIERSSGKRFKRGKFSDAEKSTIRDALGNYLAERGLTHQDFLEAFFLKKRQSKEVYSDDRFKEVFRTVAQKLDGRPILLVYQCMRRMYHPGNMRGKWNDEQDAELKRLFQIHGPDWEAIGLVMGRYGMSCRDRFKLFRGRGSTGPWTEDELVRLQNAVLQVRRQSDGRPCWLLVSEMVATRSVTQCQLKWISLEMQLNNKGQRPVWTPELEYYLITRLYELGVEHESEIIWRELMDDGWTTFFHHGMLRSRFQLLRKRVRNHRSIDMDTLLESLLLSLKPIEQLTPDIISDSETSE